MDKAVREIRKKLVPFLNSPIAINSSTGTLADISIANLENVANSALEEMEKRGEISGHRVAINQIKMFWQQVKLNSKFKKCL